MTLTDRERRILAELERQLDGPPSTADPAPRSPAADPPVEGRTRRRGTLDRAAGPAAVLGAFLLMAGPLLAVPSSALLGAALLATWLVTRHGRLLKAAGSLLVEAAVHAGAAQAAASGHPLPWWPAGSGHDRGDRPTPGSRPHP